MSALISTEVTLPLGSCGTPVQVQVMLPSGIYFYFDINDAFVWRNTEAILHSIIRVEPDEVLDIDTGEGADIFNKMIDYIIKLDCIPKNAKVSVQENQCALMRMIGDTYSNVKVIAASFPKQPTKLKLCLTDAREEKNFVLGITNV